MPDFQLPLLGSNQGMTIVTRKTGTNFVLTEHQAARLAQLWSEGTFLEEVPAPSGCEGKEGARKLKLHYARERDRKVVTLAKAAFKERHGKLFCEVCHFSFGDVYGAMGDDFIEAHHRVPLAAISDGTRTTVADLMMLCANCHRMVHTTGDPLQNLTALQHRFGTGPLGSAV